MRNGIWLGGVAVTVVALGLVYRAIGREGHETVSVQPPVAVTAAPRAKDDTKDAFSALQGLALGQRSQADLTNQKLEAIERRLAALEEAARAKEVAARAAINNVDPRTAKLISENVLVDWMEGKLRRGNGNREWTTNAKSQVQERLSALPGVEVDTVECGDKFGRVTFFQKDGAQPDVVQFLGLPPFDNESFTMPNEDGSVSIYFTAPGVRIEQLRSEAQAAPG